jgi:hypothetical protein
MTQDLVTILRDPMARTILAVLAICLTIFFFLVKRRRKRLSYILSDTRVLGVDEAVNPSRVEILFDGAPVTDVRLVIITINNSGNDPILADDFERALQLRWAEPARILTAEVVEVSPESLQPTIKTGVNEIVLNPLLLNPGDWLRIKTLINQGGKLSVDARVVGVKRITKTTASGKDTGARTMLLIAAVGVLSLIILSAGEGLGVLVPNGQAEILIFRVMVFIMLFLLVDQLKTSTLALRDYYREKKDSSK